MPQTTTNKRVLLLTDGIYPFATGGIQKHSYYLTKYLLNAGFSVNLIHCVNTIDTTPNNKEVDMLFNFEHSGKLHTTCLSFPSGIKFPGHYIYNSYKYSKQIYKIIKNDLKDYDVIYIQGFAGWKLLKVLKTKNLNAKVILNFHGLEMFQLSADFKSKIQALVLRYFVKKNLMRSPFIHSLGGKLDNILIQKLHFPKSKIISIPIGIEKSWINESIKENKNSIVNIAFVGRNERRKGFPELLEITTKLFSSGKRFQLHIIGPFDISTNSNITYYGLIKNEEEIKSILDKCQVLICCSYAEGMPTVILEAMSRGCAIAATNVGAICDQVDNSNGWLFSPANKSELESCLLKIIETPAIELETKGKKSIEKIKSKFLWDSIITKLFSV